MARPTGNTAVPSPAAIAVALVEAARVLDLNPMRAFEKPCPSGYGALRAVAAAALRQAGWHGPSCCRALHVHAQQLAPSLLTKALTHLGVTLGVVGEVAARLPPAPVAKPTQSPPKAHGGTRAASSGRVKAEAASRSPAKPASLDADRTEAGDHPARVSAPPPPDKRAKSEAPRPRRLSEMRGEISAETIKTARRLYVDELLPAAEVARRLGLSLGQVNGLVRREHWSAKRRGNAPARTPVGRERDVRRLRMLNRRGRRPSATEAKAWAYDGEPRSLMQLGRGECRWPVDGEGAETRFCGLATEDEEASWCGHHAAMAFQPSLPTALSSPSDPVWKPRRRAA